jgi:hypothetical protein
LLLLQQQPCLAKYEEKKHAFQQVNKLNFVWHCITYATKGQTISSSFLLPRRGKDIAKST